MIVKIINIITIMITRGRIVITTGSRCVLMIVWIDNITITVCRRIIITIATTGIVVMLLLLLLE